jgi:glucose/arabinose dehydrogenase
VYVSDQSAKTIFKIALPGNTVSTLATGLPAADLLLMLPNGDMLTGGGSAVTRVSQSGVVSAVPDAGSGYSDVEGMAFDPAGHRLFVIDHSSTAVQDTLHVVPFMP